MKKEIKIPDYEIFKQKGKDDNGNPFVAPFVGKGKGKKQLIICCSIVQRPRVSGICF